VTAATEGRLNVQRRLRTVFCTRGGLFGALVLRRLQACEHIEVVGIVRSSRVIDPKYGLFRGALALMRRSGITYALYMFCATTLSDGLCALLGAGVVPLHTRTASGGVPVRTTRDIHDARGLAFLRSLAPELVISAFFDQKLREPVLSLPAYGCLNIHPSLLPHFGGVDPVLQARLQKTPVLGVTVHYMTAVLDGGGILAQAAADVPAEVSVFEATARLFDAGALLLLAQIAQLRPGGEGAPQAPGGTYQSWPTRAETRALRAAGTALMHLSDLWAQQRSSPDTVRARGMQQGSDLTR
jgi:methionyl-tRNA formyltransferase